MRIVLFKSAVGMEAQIGWQMDAFMGCVLAASNRVRRVLVSNG